MVRGLIALIKTQTRRTTGLDFINENPGCWQAQWVPEKKGKHWLFTCGDDRVQLRCPYGVEGDRLWVREACRAEEAPHGIDGVRYLADDFWQAQENTADAADQWVKLYNYGKRRGSTVPPIHMPRWASRLLLEITSVRCERLQDISEADAVAEGVDMRKPAYYEMGSLMMIGDHNRGIEAFADVIGARAQYAFLWNAINGSRAWEANPWVWVVEFKIVTP